jgi:Holliday junction DNA helicase RuvA
MDPGEASIDVGGVGYRVAVPLDTWDALAEGASTMLWVSTYIREDRFELYGFSDRAGRTLFEEFLKIAGVGPRLGLELCAVPRTMLLQAIHTGDSSILTNVKGVGKKTAEKLLLELKSLLEKKPDIFGPPTPMEKGRAEYDQDAIAALATLGYDTPRILRVLRELPQDLRTTEERVAAALRTL